ncbi:MAG TPA: class I SAM-dependent methyltransferase [Tepidisphaeraceae bacterium]|jgi:ubiquinone/menaquinone biosynthesis C-methylase UbiE|nr:class I SAM-dependent methyltransferase [Tepidisphaeraceae bacterium]
MKSRRPSNDASRRYHDRVARQYDAIYDDPYWEFHDRLTWQSIKPYLPTDAASQCCDLGCGTGKWGLKLLKSGFATTFVDQSAAMIEQTRAKLHSLGAKSDKATLLVADIIDLPAIESNQFDLIVAMGDPLSICSDPARAVREMRRICRSGGTVIATADNKLAALDHFLDRGDIDGVESFLKTGKTQWLTADERERFQLTAFTPGELHRLFHRAGFEIVKLIGKTILPIREYKHLLKDDSAFDRLLRMEMELSKDSTAAAKASHLQIVARKLAEGGYGSTQVVD